MAIDDKGTISGGVPGEGAHEGPDSEVRDDGPLSGGGVDATLTVFELDNELVDPLPQWHDSLPGGVAITGRSRNSGHADIGDIDGAIGCAAHRDGAAIAATHRQGKYDIQCAVADGRRSRALGREAVIRPSQAIGRRRTRGRNRGVSFHRAIARDHRIGQTSAIGRRIVVPISVITTGQTQCHRGHEAATFHELTHRQTSYPIRKVEVQCRTGVAAE